MTVYPLPALRALALHAQGLHRPNRDDPPASPERLHELVEQIGCVQIDTLQMVARSQYLVPWSRLGAYSPADFDRLIFGPQRRLFEGWQHAASIIPLAEYRYQMPRQRKIRESPGDWYARWLTGKNNPETLALVRERIRREGAAKVSDFASDGHRGGTWWNWRPAKVALEYLYAWGELMIADRVSFQRVYDLTERLLPAWVERSEPSASERDRQWIERGARALGVCTGRQAGDYTWMKVTQARPQVEALVKAGVLLPIRGRLADGETGELLVHRDNLAFLEQAASGELHAERTTFLSPFDNLFWAGGRDEQLWGFRKSLEAYLPAHKRTYGYFCLPILHRDRLVGRFDPKLERKSGRLHLKSFYLEPGVRPDERLVAEVAAALRDFMRFHQARELVIEASQPKSFGKKLLQAVGI